MTNELAGSDYHLDLAPILEGINVDQIFAFDGGNKNETEQLSSLLALVSEIPGGEGTNPLGGSNLGLMIECTLANDCFANEEESLSAGFINCYLFSGLFSDPPCSSEFNSVMMTANLPELAKCVLPGDDIDIEYQLKDLASPLPQIDPFMVSFEENTQASFKTHRNLQQPSGLPRFPGKDQESALPEDTDKDSTDTLDFVLCLAGALLPQDAQDQITDIVNDMLGIAGFVFDVVEKGIYIPGKHDDLAIRVISYIVI